MSKRTMTTPKRNAKKKYTIKPLRWCMDERSGSRCADAADALGMRYTVAMFDKRIQWEVREQLSHRLLNSGPAKSLTDAKRLCSYHWNAQIRRHLSESR